MPSTATDLPRDDVLKARITSALRHFERRAAEPGLPGDPAMQHAAVALAVVDEGHGADLRGFPCHAGWSAQAALRSLQLRRHAGQWALPGGRLEPGETPEQAALREMAEEVDLRLDEDTVLGCLDDYVTCSGFVITPVVVWAGAARTLTPDPAEVASVHRIPLVEFLRTDAPWLDPSTASDHAVLRMPIGQDWIAAPTAALIYQFREVCLEGRTTRVAHFDQPPFAWR